MLSVVRLVSFWRCIPMQYNCQKSSNFQGLSHFSRIFGKNDKIPGFFQAGKTVTIFPGFPGAVGTLAKYKMLHLIPIPIIASKLRTPFYEHIKLEKLFTRIYGYEHFYQRQVHLINSTRMA